MWVKTKIQNNKMSKSKYIAIGQVIKQVIRNETKISKVRVPNMTLDKRLLMYFPVKSDKWAVDVEGVTKLGDVVVISKSNEKLLDNMNIFIESVLYQVGETVDPVTGRPCRGTEFIDEESRKDEQSKRSIEEFKITKIVKNVS